MAPSTSLSTSHTVIITVLYSLTLIGAVTGNLLLIFIIIKRRETRTLTGFLFVNMAVADLIVAIFVLPATMSNPYTGSKWLTGLFGDITCRGVYFVFHVTIAASILSLMFMAIDRYLAVLFPLRSFTTFRRPKLLTLVIWLVSVIVMVPVAVMWTVDQRGDCVAEFTVFGTDEMQGMRGYYLYLFLLFYLTPLSVISVLYGRVCFKLWRRQMPGLVTSETERRRGATKRKVVRTLIIITAVFAVCWLPTQAYHLIFGFDYRLHEQSPQIVMYMCFWLGHTNSAFNPWLYMLLTDKFRRALRDFIHCKFSSLGLRPETSVKYTHYTSVRDNSLVKRPPSTTRLRGNGLLKASDEEETPI